MPDDTEHIRIDGDKVIAFSNAVRSLADMFEQLNIIALKDFFTVGKQMGTINAVIETEARWKEALHGIRRALEIEVQGIETNKNTLRDMAALMKLHLPTIRSVEQVNIHLKEFVELCDRLEKHKQAGTLELVSKLVKA